MKKFVYFLLIAVLVLSVGLMTASADEEMKVVVYSSHDSDPLNDAVNALSRH